MPIGACQPQPVRLALPPPMRANKLSGFLSIADTNAAHRANAATWARGGVDVIFKLSSAPHEQKQKKRPRFHDAACPFLPACHNVYPRAFAKSTIISKVVHFSAKSLFPKYPRRRLPPSKRLQTSMKQALPRPTAPIKIRALGLPVAAR